jgi:hypothetical protein
MQKGKVIPQLGNLVNRDKSTVPTQYNAEILRFAQAAVQVHMELSPGVSTVYASNVIGVYLLYNKAPLGTTLILPPAAGLFNKQYIIKNINTGGPANFTVAAASGDRIENGGPGVPVVMASLGTVWLVSDGIDKWWKLTP